MGLASSSPELEAKSRLGPRRGVDVRRVGRRELPGEMVNSFAVMVVEHQVLEHQVPADSRHEAAGVRILGRNIGGLEERRHYWEGRGRLIWWTGRWVLGVQ
jgi:hypothetical protein